MKTRRASRRRGTVRGTPRGRPSDAPGRCRQEDRPAYYVGLDVQGQFTTFVIQDDTAAMVARGTVPTTPEGFARLRQTHDVPAETRVALETGTSSFYVARPLADLELRPIVIDAHEVRLKAHRPAQKSDRRDAFERCDGLRRGIYRSIVYVPPLAISRLRTTLSRRPALHPDSDRRGECDEAPPARGGLARGDPGQLAQCRQLGAIARGARRGPGAARAHPPPSGRVAAGRRTGPRPRSSVGRTGPRRAGRWAPPRSRARRRPH